MAEKRREAVASLRESGLSLRAIAAATGISKSTVSDELSGVRNEPQNRTPDVLDEDA
ncbi:MAG: helix-turn-helix domain-containing protein, partial [Mycobacterium sp.]|nr:helix-turn-helix domain-containing protein [Mycobacterium sp.]